MKKEKLEKIRIKDINLSDEITKNSKKYRDIFGYVPKPHSMFVSEIPYRKFIIIISHMEMPKEFEDVYYRRSIYGWWAFCAKKDEIDKIDKEVLEKPYEYCQYIEKEHTFCNDNQQEEEVFYSLHPNDMVKKVKESIDKFYKNREKLKGGG